jgi:hypothetical protein
LDGDEPTGVPTPAPTPVSTPAGSTTGSSTADGYSGTTASIDNDAFHLIGGTDSSLKPLLLLVTIAVFCVLL